jgi:hypothetical protein
MCIDNYKVRNYNIKKISVKLIYKNRVLETEKHRTKVLEYLPMSALRLADIGWKSRIEKFRISLNQCEIVIYNI